MKNRKGHFDLVCLTGSFLVLIFGGVVAFFSISKGDVSPILIGAFGIVIIISIMIHIFHHGFMPISGIISLVLIIFAMILLRGLYGDGNALIEWYGENLFYVTIAIIILDFSKTIAS